MPHFSRRPRWWLPVVVCAWLSLLSACDRAFVEPEPPQLRIVAPESFDQVFMQAAVPLHVEATSFRRVDRVELEGEPMTYDEAAGLWKDTLHLQEGLNTFYVTAYDVDGVSRRDTLHAAYVPGLTFAPGPSLPAPRGGHTATLLPDGRLLVAGGAPAAGAPAAADAYVLDPEQACAATQTRPLNEARTGHTATLLPDGRVLILGGSRTDNLNSVSDLVVSAEMYDPTTETFTRIPSRGDPVQRALHTAAVRRSDGALIIDVYGGRGNISYTAEPRLGYRGDLRRFRLQSNSLIALDPRIGPNLSNAPLAGHTQTPMASTAPGSATRTLIAGAYFRDDYAEAIGFVVDFAAPSWEPRYVPVPFQTPRMRHAAVLLEPDFVLFLGGRQQAPSSALQAFELYADRALQAFRFSADAPGNFFARRYGHTATKLPSHRILTVGGFAPSGNGLSAAVYIDVPLAD